MKQEVPLRRLYNDFHLRFDVAPANLNLYNILDRSQPWLMHNIEPSRNMEMHIASNCHTGTPCHGMHLGSARLMSREVRPSHRRCSLFSTLNDTSILTYRLSAHLQLPPDWRVVLGCLALRIGTSLRHYSTRQYNNNRDPMQPKILG